MENKISTEKLISVSKSNTAVNKIPQLFPNKSLLKILCVLQNITELKTLDLSGNVITEELAEQLAIVLANSTKLEVLLLEDCFLGNKGVNVIANSLKNITTLKHLGLCNNNITEEVAIVNILNGKAKLTELYLHKNCLQFSAGDSLSDNFVNLKRLKALSIDQNIISKNMAIKFANSYFPTTEMEMYIYDNDHQTTEIVKFRDSFKNISVLTLCKSYNERGGDLLVTLILKNESELHWNQSNVLRSMGVVRFLSGFRNITTIKVLNISGIEFTELEVDTIATVIGENVQLENLWLGGQAVNDALVSDSNTLFKGNKQLVSPNQLKAYLRDQEMFPCKLLLKLFLALKFKPNLKRLDFSGNVITEELAEQLAIVLTNSIKLEAFLLGSCSLGNESVNLIAKFLSNISTLIHLDLSNNEITEDSVIFSIIEANTGLEKLRLHRNCLHSTGDHRLSDAIVNLKNLKELSIDQNIFSRNMALKLLSGNTNGKLLVYNHDYQTTEVLHNKGSLCNINTLTLSKFSINIPLITTVLETGTAVLRWYQATALSTTGILKVFSAVNKISTIKLHKFDNELNELEVDAIAAIISDNVTLTNVWLGSHSHKVVYDDFDALTNEHNNDNVDCCNDLELLSPKVQLISHTQLFKILLALKHNANLETLDLSGNVITDELAEQLAIVLAYSTKLKTLLLRDCSLDSIGIHVIVNSLKNITTLKQLSLSWDSITDVATNYLATVIKCNIGLEKLYLDGNLQYFDQLSTAIKEFNLELLQIDHKVIAEDVNGELVNNIINNSNLKYLILKNHSLQITGVVKFETYPRNIKSLMVMRINEIVEQDPGSVVTSVDESKIIVRCFQDNILASTGIMKVVGAFKNVTSVSWCDFTLNEHTDKDVDEIVTVMNSFTELEELVMHGYSTVVQNYVFNSLNMLNNLMRLNLSCSRIVVPSLQAFLLNNCKIQELQMSYCLLKSSEVSEILNALEMHAVQSLYLYNNNITNIHDIADTVGQLLLKNQGMQKFHIGNNNLQAEGIMKILGVLKQLRNLNELSVGGNNTDKISDNIEKARLCDFLVEVITNNLKLEMLAIGNVFVHGDEAAKVVVALKSLSCLKLLDISSNNINEKAADDIATVFTNNPNLVKFSVADNCLGTDGISKIVDALVSPRGLEIFDITNNNISVGAADSISKVITNNPQLKFLLLGEEKMLSDNNNRLTLINSKLCHCISTKKLNNVFINTQMLDIKRYTKIIYFSQFSNCISRSSDACHKLFSDDLALRSSHLMKCNYNKLQSEGIKKISQALATIKTLEVLSIENNDINDQAADYIATGLASNNKIKQLWIGQNNFTPSGISIILRSLLVENISEDGPKPTLPTLLILDLSYNNLSLQTAIDVAAVLSRNHTVQQLWLEGNNLPSQCVEKIADALKKCTNILVLSLRGNNINEDTAKFLTEALSKMPFIQELYLGNSHLQDRGVINITEALSTRYYLFTLDLMNNNISESTADALASVITSCSQLEQLYLGDNKLQSAGTIKIARALQQANCRSTLRVLDLSNNRIGSDKTVSDEISRAVANTELLTVLILDDNAFSVNGVWKITRSLNQSEYMMIFSVMRNDVMISEETKDEMRAVMADQQPDCVMYL